MPESQSAIVALLGALRDEDYGVRFQAAIALGRTGSHAVPALLTALEDTDDLAKPHIMYALGEIGDPVAIPALLNALKKEPVYVADEAAIALGKIGDISVIDQLIEAYNSGTGQRGVIIALMTMRADLIVDSRIIGLLLSALKDDDLREHAARTLELLDFVDEQIVEALIDAVWYEEAKVHDYAVTIIRKAGDFAFQPLIDTLKHPDSAQRWFAINQLVNLGDTRAVPYLETVALEDVDPRIRDRATRALEQLR